MEWELACSIFVFVAGSTDEVISMETPSFNSNTKITKRKRTNNLLERTLPPWAWIKLLILACVSWSLPEREKNMPRQVRNLQSLANVTFESIRWLCMTRFSIIRLQIVIKWSKSKIKPVCWCTYNHQLKLNTRRYTLAKWNLCYILQTKIRKLWFNSLKPKMFTITLVWSNEQCVS